MNINHRKNPTMVAQIVNFGCKLNQFEGGALKEELIEKGIDTQIVKPSELNHQNNNRYIYIINTCTVTSKSDRKSRNAIYKAVALKKDDDIIIVTGCYAQTDGEELSKIKGVDYVVNNLKKPLILEIPTKGMRLDFNKIDVKDEFVFSYKDPIKLDRSRAYVKVQDGCSMNCSYCKIPMARGKSISRPLNEIIDYIKRLEEAGYHEVVLTGINLGSYKSNTINLAHLLEKIIKATKDIRIRLSSIEPMYFEEGLFDILCSERIVPHFHVPLQSGSNRILRLMRRPYDSVDYIRVIEKLGKVKYMPHLATDIIVGFPTEKGSDFEESKRIVEELSFSSLHIFVYSPRRGTDAEKMRDDVNTREKSRRSQMLIELGKELNYKYRLKFLHSTRKAIFERHSSKWIGVTDNYIKVTLLNNTHRDLRREKITIKILKVTPQNTYAKVFDDSE